MRNLGACCLLVAFGLLTGCARFVTRPVMVTPMPSPQSPNLDAQTQALIAHASHVVFVIPFSHWDTDWHEAFPDYVKRSDQNILAAIQMAKQYPRFRYALEQVLFVKHFWDNYPEYRADLKALVQNRQFTFAWAGITQPETSLVAPAIQARNLQLGQDWIASTFGPAYVPRTAWQSDAFGNSAALPIFLNRLGVSYLFIGRWQDRCDPDYEKCNPLPLAFYWTGPVALPSGSPAARVLVAYLSYPTAWDAIHTLADQDQQIARLSQVIDAQFKRTTSKYIFLPMGSDFQDPLPGLPTLVERWNSLSGQRTALVMADPETAFQYLATQNLPQVTTDLNPIWQAFYDTRPEAKIADKEIEYLLTAADKFGLLLDSPQSSVWLTATINAHYDNISGVSFDSVWESTQRPRFEQAIASAANDLADILARIASRVSAIGISTGDSQGTPLLIFNPTSWARSEVVEIKSDLFDAGHLPAPVQRLGPDDIAFRVESVPPVGFAALTGGEGTGVGHPASVSRTGGLVTLTNNLVAVTLDAGHGGAFSSLAQAGGSQLLSTFGDDVVYLDDTGDVYGASFGKERARESQATAQVTVLAQGPLIARAQAVFTLGDQPITKTVTLRADSPLIEVTLDIKALPQTTALVQTPTTLVTDVRTDDLGLAAFQHQVDTRPIVPGDVTYRRKIFYPITYWSDVSAHGHGLTLITHGLQGVNGTGTLNLMLVREVSDQGQEGVTDSEYHTLRYAYVPHAGDAAQAQPWLAAYAFNQPLIPVWRSGSGESVHLNVQLPFGGGVMTRQLEIVPGAPSLPSSLSLMSAQGSLIADVYRQASQIQALVINYDPSQPAIVRTGPDVEPITLPGAALTLTPVELK